MRTWSLIAGVADGTIDSASATTRRRAAVLESRLRSLIDGAQITSPALRREIDRIVEHAAARDVALGVHVLDDDPTAELGDRTVEAISRLLDAHRGGQVQVSLLPGSVLATVPEGADVDGPWEPVERQDGGRILLRLRAEGPVS